MLQGFGNDRKRPVGESRVIELQRAMVEFRDSDDLELAFPPGLDSHERATLHEQARKMGLYTKSTGKGGAGTNLRVPTRELWSAP